MHYNKTWHLCSDTMTRWVCHWSHTHCATKVPLYSSCGREPSISSLESSSYKWSLSSSDGTPVQIIKSWTISLIQYKIEWFLLLNNLLFLSLYIFQQNTVITVLSFRLLLHPCQVFSKDLYLNLYLCSTLMTWNSSFIHFWCRNMRT